MTDEQNWPQKYDINRLISIQKDIDKIIAGKKTSVRRNDRYGDPGDTIKLNQEEFFVHNVYPQKLGDMTEQNARAEGYESLDAFIKGMSNIHGESIWDPNMTVWVHELKHS